MNNSIFILISVIVYLPSLGFFIGNLILIRLRDRGWGSWNESGRPLYPSFYQLRFIEPSKVSEEQKKDLKDRLNSYLVLNLIIFLLTSYVLYEIYSGGKIFSTIDLWRVKFFK